MTEPTGISDLLDEYADAAIAWREDPAGRQQYEEARRRLVARFLIPAPLPEAVHGDMPDDAVTRALYRVWCASTDSALSPDFEGDDETRERYRLAIMAEARKELMAAAVPEEESAADPMFVVLRWDRYPTWPSSVVSTVVDDTAEATSIALGEATRAVARGVSARFTVHRLTWPPVVEMSTEAL